MAAQKAKNLLKDKLSLFVQFPKVVGYADYYYKTFAAIQIKNDGAEAVNVKVKAENADGLLVPYETTAEVPFESSVELNAEGIFSPLFLAENDELRECAAEVVLFAEDAEICRASAQVSVLPYDWWGGLESNAEFLAAYVRPKLADCANILADAGARLKKWKVNTEFYGYAGTDKNTVRQIVAAVYAALKSRAIERTEETDLSLPAAAGKELILKEGKANELQLAVLAAACLEAARLHPVIAVGKNAVSVGVWLYDSCFLDTVTDDAEIVGKYVSDGINNLSFFDVSDLFSARNIAFTPSETHFKQKLQESYYEYFVDIRRCRIGRIMPLPLRGSGLHGYELIKEEDATDENAPAPLPSFRKLNLEGKQPKNKQWERRLLDMTAKNQLLNFSGRNALHLCSANVDALYGVFAKEDSVRLRGSVPREVPEPAFGAEGALGLERELIELEQGKGIVRAFCDAKTLGEVTQRLMRKNKEADEETGAKILYLAFGFLKYVSKEDGQAKYAPLVLMPVNIRRAKGNEDFALDAGEKEYSVNSTLLEFLKQEFNIDVRGLGGDVSALKISEILAMVRAETANMKGWDVCGDVYLATFSFQRYLMWNDLRRNFAELKKNALVSALMSNRADYRAAEATEEDESYPTETLTPLPADSSQFSAISLSQTGTSFVLHGPPGTGKSQTITNIIANALEDGKRVLFVAEKKAALDVVKKRLDTLGIGDFCLELHSNKADKADVLRRMENTLELKREEGEYGYSERAEEIVRLREQLKEPLVALHKKRRLGISVYQAILYYLQNKSAPDILDIESSFYDTLTEQRLAECKSMILSAAAAAKECGGVCNSPFENVNLTQYSQGLRDTVYCSCEVVLTEIRHLKAYLALFLEFYRQKISTLTQRKLDLLAVIAENLASGMYQKYFSRVDEHEFYLFYNANKRLDDCLAYYFKYFRTLVEPGKDFAELKRFCEEGGDYRLCKAAVSAAKRLSRAAINKPDEEDIPKFLQTLVEIYEAIDRVRKNTALSANFCDRAGNVNFKRRSEFLADLYRLHEMCSGVFMDYNPDAFNGMCIRAANGYTAPVLDGYRKASASFAAAQGHFLTVTNADRDQIREEDVLDYYSSKASALLDNIDMLPNWCMYRATAEQLGKAGLTFISDALESGRLRGENILSGFEKNVYKNFLEINIPADPCLSRMTVGTLEDTIEKFRLEWEEFSRLSRDKIRADLISRLPAADAEGSLSVEVSAFTRLSKSNLRGVGLRGLFEEIPELVRRVAPCMLMSPITVAQYLQPVADQFDLVIFDEASQMSTAEAIGSIARAKSAIVVGDPKQLPPTSFFHSAYVDEENLENEDLESILDDCLALGMPERHLLWHYRSKHESLIAFSNIMYYDNKLCTFPSPDSLESKVKFIQVDGTYDRGFTKRNRKEAEALVAEVIRRLSDPALARSSMGVVTFSSAQRDDIDKLLSRAIAARHLESAAYEREEPLFVKNLENVQGDERDVILFSVCYGPDQTGRVSLNFGPLNQTGGWRRLNVAVSRAREEMLIFSTMTSAMIDLGKTSSKGVAGLKAFLEFAEKGRTTLAVNSAFVKGGAGIGKFIAAELTGCGYDCRCDVGASDFKIDVAVVDPKNKHRFILAVLCDGTTQFSVKDRNVLQVQTLKRGNWNIMRVYAVNYYNNPKREIKRIKEMLDRLTGADKKAGAWLNKYRRPYRAVKETGAETAVFVTGGENDAAIMARLKEIVATEEPISRAFLKKRCLATFGIAKSGAKVESRLDSLIDACAFRRERVFGDDYFYKNDRALSLDRFRVENAPVLRKTEEDFTPFEIVSFVRGALEDRVALYMDEVMVILCNIFHVIRPGEKFTSFVRDCISLGEDKGLFVRSVSDRISLA